jgi:uncharacterized membrane protein
MALDTPGPPIDPSPGEHPDGAGQSAADPAEGDQPPAAVQAPAGAAVPPAGADAPAGADTPVGATQSAVAVLAAEAVAEGPQPSPEPGKRRKLLYATLPGCWGALIFACLSFTPSLLPRGGIVQGLVWGITAAIGYGLGVLAAWVWRAFADRDPRRPRRWAWVTFFIVAGVLLVAAFALGQYWQYEIRKLMGVTDYNIPLVVASPFIAALIFGLLLLIGRGLHGLYRPHLRGGQRPAAPGLH